MAICGVRNIVIYVLICNDSVLRQFSDKELFIIYKDIMVKGIEGS